MPDVGSTPRTSRFCVAPQQKRSGPNCQSRRGELGLQDGAQTQRGPHGKLGSCGAISLSSRAATLGIARARWRPAFIDPVRRFRPSASRLRFKRPVASATVTHARGYRQEPCATCVPGRDLRRLISVDSPLGVLGRVASADFTQIASLIAGAFAAVAGLINLRLAVPPERPSLKVFAGEWRAGMKDRSTTSRCW